MTERQRRAHLLAWLVIGPMALIVIALAMARRPAPVAAPAADPARPGMGWAAGAPR
jgi:hypothetical protein